MSKLSTYLLRTVNTSISKEPLTMESNILSEEQIISRCP